jgi:type IV fimbrial biogenesis protein FimT
VLRPIAAKGYSLYELLITVTLVSLVLTLGLPSFGKISAGQRLRTETDRLFHAIHLARKSSVARRRPITLCPSIDGASCSSAYDWSSGWIMFVNTDGDSPVRRDEGEPILKAHSVDPQVRITANRQGFTLRSTELRATNGTLVVCDRGGRAQNRALVVSYTGRPRVSREDSRGKAWQCSD